MVQQATLGPDHHRARRRRPTPRCARPRWRSPCSGYNPTPGRHHHPRLQRGGRPRGQRAEAPRLSERARCPSASGSPWPTTPAPTARGPSPVPSKRELPDVLAVHLDAKGPGPGPCATCGRERRGRARLHGRRSLHRPRRGAAPGGAAGVGPQRHGHRHPAGARVARRARRQARGHLALLQLPAPHRPWRRGSPTPSAASRRSGPTGPGRCCRWSRTRGGSSTPSCCSWPSGPGMRIHEVPVDWVDDPDSRVDLVATALEDLEGRGPAGARAWPPGPFPSATLRESTVGGAGRWPARPGLFAQLARFCAVGVVSTVAYVVLYVVLRTGMPALGANALALLVTAVANTAVNRRVTFGVRSATAASPPPAPGHRRVRRRASALTSGALAALHDLGPGAGRGLEVARPRDRRRRRHRRALRPLPFLGVPRRRPGDRRAPLAPTVITDPAAIRLSRSSR